MPNRAIRSRTTLELLVQFLLGLWVCYVMGYLRVNEIGSSHWDLLVENLHQVFDGIGGLFIHSEGKIS